MINKKVLIIYSPDKYANGVKPTQLKKYFLSYGCYVDMLPTNLLSRMGTGKISKWLPKIKSDNILLYFIEAIGIISDLSKVKIVKKYMRSITIEKVIKLRGKI